MVISAFEVREEMSVSVYNFERGLLKTFGAYPFSPPYYYYYYYHHHLTQYCAGDKIEKNEMGGACGTYGGRERCAQGKREGKRPLGRPRRRWEDNIKTHLEEAGRGCGD